MKHSEKWEAIKKQLLLDIEELDNDTHWAETEPKWWLEMVEVQRTVLNQNNREGCSNE